MTFQFTDNLKQLLILSIYLLFLTHTTGQQNRLPKFTYTGMGNGARQYQVFRHEQLL